MANLVKPMATLLTPRPLGVGVKTLRTAIGEALNDPETTLVVGERGAATPAGLLTVHDSSFAIFSTSEPAQKRDFESAIAFHDESDLAQSDVDAHVAHLSVTALERAEDHEDAIRLSGLTTEICAAIAEVIGATAMHWAPSNELVPADRLAAAARDLAENGQLPLDFWVSARPLTSCEKENASKTVVSQGLAAFVPHELRLDFGRAPLSPESVFGRLYGVAGYLIAKGPVIEDGDTIGGRGGERVTVAMQETPGCAYLTLSLGETLH